MDENRNVGTFNVTGPNYELMIEELLNTCKKVTRSDAKFVWVEERFIREHNDHGRRFLYGFLNFSRWKEKQNRGKVHFPLISRKLLMLVFPFDLLKTLVMMFTNGRNLDRNQNEKQEYHEKESKNY